MSNIVLKLKKVTKLFGGKGDVPSVEIFKEMDFTIKKNEVVGLFSPSGSGKTTFLQIAGLLDSKFSGDININGLRINTKNDIQTSIVRRKNIGFVFQFHHLIQEFSALDNTIFPLLFDGVSEKIAIQKGQHLLFRLRSWLFTARQRLFYDREKRIAYFQLCAFSFSAATTISFRLI